MKDKKWNWLENQLVRLLPEARIWTFGYNSSWCGDFSVDTVLNEVAGTLLDAIIAKALVFKCSKKSRLIDVYRTSCLLLSSSLPTALVVSSC